MITQESVLAQELNQTIANFITDNDVESPVATGVTAICTLLASVIVKYDLTTEEITKHIDDLVESQRTKH